MSYYLVQASYGAAAYGAMVSHPQDRAAAVRPLIEKMGGKLHGMWLSFGEFDVVAIAEMLDAVSAAVDSLTSILGAHSGAILAQDLARIAELPDEIRLTGNQPSRSVDCTHLRNKAREELLRRP